MKPISLRKIRYVLKHHTDSALSTRQRCKLLKISKSTYYRILRRYRGINNIYSIKQRVETKQGRKIVSPQIKHIDKIIQYRLKYKTNANTVKLLLSKHENIQISHHSIYNTLKSANMVDKQNKKRKKNSWVRWERKHSLSLWQTDWTHFNGKYLMVMIDDASRLVVGWGLFDNATSENSVKVLKEAISKHGKPKEMLTGHDMQFYAPEWEDGRKRGRTVFERFLEANGIKHILARVNHPQTCGKIERFFGEVKTRINRRHDFSAVGEVIEWHNELKPHMSLRFDELETPAQAFVRKMHHNTRIVKSYNEVESDGC